MKLNVVRLEPSI